MMGVIQVYIAWSIKKVCWNTHVQCFPLSMWRFGMIWNDSWIRWCRNRANFDRSFENCAHRMLVMSQPWRLSSFKQLGLLKINISYIPVCSSVLFGFLRHASHHTKKIPANPPIASQEYSSLGSLHPRNRCGIWFLQRSNGKGGSWQVPVGKVSCSNMFCPVHSNIFSMILSDQSNHSEENGRASLKSDGFYSTFNWHLAKPRFLQMAEERMQKATFTCLPQENSLWIFLDVHSNSRSVRCLFFRWFALLFRCSKALAVENKIRTTTGSLIETPSKETYLERNHKLMLAKQFWIIDLDVSWYGSIVSKKNLVFRVIQNRAFAGRRRSTMSRAVAVATGLQEQQIPRNHQRVEWQSRRLSLRGKRGVTHPNRKWNLHVYFGFTWSEEVPCTTILIGGLVATLSGSAHIRTQMFWFSSSSSPILLFDLYMCTCILKSCWSFIFRMIKMLRVSYFDRVLVFDQFWRAIVQEFVLTHHGKKPRATERELGSLGIVNLLWSLMARFAFGRKMSRKKWGGENKCFFPIQNLDKIHTMSKHQKIDINNETWVRSGYAVPGIPSWFVIIFFSFILL